MTGETSIAFPRMRALLLLAFAALPLISSPAIQEHIYLQIPYLHCLAIIVWMVAAGRSVFSGWLPPRPPLLRTCAVWLVVAALSFLWANARALVPVAMFRDFVIITSAGAFAMLASPRRSLALQLMGGMAMLALGWTLYHHFRYQDAYTWKPFYQASLAGGFAAVVLAGTVSALLAAWPSTLRGRVLMALGIGLAVLAAVTLWRSGALTASGAAAAGIVAGICISRGPVGRRLACIVPIVALFSGGAILYIMGSQAAHPSAEIRVLLWEGALGMLQDNWFFGVGYGGFGASFPHFRPEEYWSTQYATAWSPHAHSLYGELAAELGLVGLCLAPILVIRVLQRGSERMASARTAEDRSAGAAVMGAFVAVCVVAIADLFADYPLGRFLFFALGGLAYSRTVSEEVARGKTIDLFTRRALLIGVSALLVYYGYHQYYLVKSRAEYLRADHARRAALELSTRLDTARASGTVSEEEILALARERGRYLMASFDGYQAAAISPHFPTTWSLRARLQTAQTALQLASETREARDRYDLLRFAQALCADVGGAVQDFEDTELLYAMTEFELGNQEYFERRMKSYLVRRVGWDLRPLIPGEQNGPTMRAWEIILRLVPPEEPFFRWTAELIEKEAERIEESLLPNRAQSQARRVANEFRSRLP